MYIFLFLFFIILNGKLTLEVCLLGLVLTGLLMLFLYILFGYTPAKDLRFLKKLPLLLVYFFVLLKEIFIAGLHMIGLIFKKNQELHPVLVTFNSGLNSEFCRFLLANSITLTPGTITVELKDDLFTVHCLDRSMLDITDSSVFLRWLKKLEA